MPATERDIDGEIWERNDELFIVEKVYGASRQPRPTEGTMPALVPITLVMIRCIDPMPQHIELGTFLEKWKPYAPHDEEDEGVDQPEKLAQRSLSSLPTATLSEYRGEVLADWQNDAREEEC